MKKQKDSDSQKKRGCVGSLLRLVGLVLLIWGIARLREYLAYDEEESVPSPPPSPAVAQSPPPAPEHTSSLSASVETGDDLTQIQNIGPVFAKKLKEAGITTFTQLASQTPAQLEAICQVPDWRKPDYASWIYQAQQLSQDAS